MNPRDQADFVVLQSFVIMIAQFLKDHPATGEAFESHLRSERLNRRNRFADQAARDFGADPDEQAVYEGWERLWKRIML